MTTILVWKGIGYQSMEHCTVIATPEGNTIHSVIIGSHEEHPFKVVYEIRTNPQWETLMVKVEASLGPDTWNCLIRPNAYPDISLSPFTNTLPIRGLPWTERQYTIDVIYFDILAREARPDQQVYHRKSPDTIGFATIDGSFQADIRIDEEGYVIDYPELFTRIAKEEMKERSQNSSSNDP